LEKGQQKEEVWKSYLLLETLIQRNTEKLSHSMTKFLSIYYLTFFASLFLKVFLPTFS